MKLNSPWSEVDHPYKPGADSKPIGNEKVICKDAAVFIGVYLCTLEIAGDVALENFSHQLVLLTKSGLGPKVPRSNIARNLNKAAS
jgi:hypothetical protein